jgi:hypothetical protein
MTGPNGHAHENGVTTSVPPTAAPVAPMVPQFSPERVKELVAALEVPFDPSQIEWRVMNTTKNGQPMRGQVVPYADQRAYTDRLNALFTPAGWTRKYSIHASANFERSKDQKIAAKVLVTCELAIFGLGLHSATGEEWADNDNAGTSAEAQAFKRACSCFGLGRYLYYCEGVWVDLDERKRPRSIPQLPSWATPTGWAQDLRPNGSGRSNPSGNGANVHNGGSQTASLVKEIESMAELLGRGLYRGLLRDMARVWNPREIESRSVLEKVLEHMRSAERGLLRLEAALDKTGPEALAGVLKTLGLSSLERVDKLETLKRIVLELERAGDTAR